MRLCQSVFECVCDGPRSWLAVGFLVCLQISYFCPCLFCYWVFLCLSLYVSVCLSLSVYLCMYFCECLSVWQAKRRYYEKSQQSDTQQMTLKDAQTLRPTYTQRKWENVRDIYDVLARLVHVTFVTALRVTADHCAFFSLLCLLVYPLMPVKQVLFYVHVQSVCLCKNSQFTGQKSSCLYSNILSAGYLSDDFAGCCRQATRKFEVFCFNNSVVLCLSY